MSDKTEKVNITFKSGMIVTVELNEDEITGLFYHFQRETISTNTFIGFKNKLALNMNEVAMIELLK